MNELSLFEPEEKVMTTKEVAAILGTKPNVITENGKKCLPNKKIENGKVTYWDKAEITVLVEYLKNNNSNQHDLSGSLIGIKTELTPALKLKKALDLAQEAYEEELARLRFENAEKQAVIDRIAEGKGCFTMNQTAKALKRPYGNIKMFEELRKMGFLNQDNTPKQEQINAGHFKVVVKFINEKVGNKSVTLTTSKGLVYLAKKFNTEIDKSIKADA